LFVDPAKKKPFENDALEGLHPVYLALWQYFYADLFPRSGIDMAEGRSSGFRIKLLFAPSHLIKTKQWYLASFVPVYSGGTAPDSHGIPY
jgi:hypothetical protein